VRIVSLVPSATEIIGLLGLQDWLIGRSHECDFPPGIENVPVLTTQSVHATDPREIDEHVRAHLAAGTSLYRLDSELLRKLEPDLLVTQDLCHVCSIDLPTVHRIAATMPRPPRVLSLNPHTLEQVFDDIIAIATACGVTQRGVDAVVQLRERMHTAQDCVNVYEPPRSVAFLEWTDPLFVAGHWTPQLIERAGGEQGLNPTKPLAGTGSAAGPQMASRVAGPSRQISPEELIASDPEVICSPCGMNLQASKAAAAAFLKQPWSQQLQAARSGRIAIIDGNQYFSRPGPRLIEGFAFLVGYLQGRPELVPPGFAWSKP
jgi:hypothetical protein